MLNNTDTTIDGFLIFTFFIYLVLVSLDLNFSVE